MWYAVVVAIVSVIDDDVVVCCCRVFLLVIVDVSLSLSVLSPWFVVLLFVLTMMRFCYCC